MTNEPTIYLAFTDDWELRGDGSGDIEQIQFEPMRRLLSSFENHGVRGTFMAEMMQQLAFRREQERFPQLRALAHKWDDHVRGAYTRGHDIQLHLHTQWSNAVYDDGIWKLRGDWSILNYERGEAEQMLSAGKDYLEDLLRPIDPNYKCVAFRGSYLAIAPSAFILGLLAKLGIELDTSIVGGLRVNTRNIQLDYIGCAEDFLPFYPDMTDARRVSDKLEPITCVPIFHFTGSRRRVAGQIMTKVRDKLTERFNKTSKSPGFADDPAVEIGRSSMPARIYDKIASPVIFGKHLTADIGQLGLPLLQEMISAIRIRARESGQSHIPVVLTNHTKNMKDFSGFARFLGEITSAEDIKTITLTELAAKLRSGEFNVRRADSRP